MIRSLNSDPWQAFNSVISSRMAVPTRKHREVWMTVGLDESDGQTSNALGIALAMARRNQTTLLIDGDFRKPSLHRSHKLSNDRGFADVLAGTAEIEDVLQSLQTSGADRATLDVVTAGIAKIDAGELFSTARLNDVLESAREKYCVTMITTAAANTAKDALLLAGHVDAVFLVVSSGSTRRAPIVHFKEELIAAGANIAGLIINNNSNPVPKLVRKVLFGD